MKSIDLYIIYLPVVIIFLVVLIYPLIKDFSVVHKARVYLRCKGYRWETFEKAATVSGIISVFLVLAQNYTTSYKSEMIQEKNFADLATNFVLTKQQNLDIISSLNKSAASNFMIVETDKLVELDRLHIEALLLNPRTTECFNINELIKLNQDIKLINSIIPLVRELGPSVGTPNKFSEYVSQLIHVNDMTLQLLLQYEYIENSCENA
ncbi:hypothetical protein [Vibrio rotiferianus]|uniref:hypothetical protein n=1 Tax=Vibrio rotiferianus TaxID=190895 RepID=UPI0005EF1BA7|nr:hypothetical protein [Vibrio rotiferianus]